MNNDNNLRTAKHLLKVVVLTILQMIIFWIADKEPFTWDTFTKILVINTIFVYPLWLIIAFILNRIEP
jgi:hypothetical protein